MYAAAFALFSCENDDIRTLSNASDKGLNIDMTGLSLPAAMNTRIYVFKGSGTSRGEFSHRILRINRTENMLSASVPEGTWDFGLVTCEDDAAVERLVEPIPGVRRAECKMYEALPQNGVLPSVPELYTTRVDGQPVVADRQHDVSVSFSRNVAMVKLVIGEVKGMKTGSVHSVYLGNVPTTINWDGGLYPDKNAPAVGNARMKGAFTISDVASGGLQRSDTAVFIIPAHKGGDFLSTNPVDTSTHKLAVSVDLIAADGTHYVRSDVTLPVVPKVNKILVVNLLVRGSLEVRSSILDWADTTLYADISHTTLNVGKSNVGLSRRDTIIVSTNAASRPTLTSGDEWLTASFIDSVRVALAADAASYTAPRSSWIDVSVNNVTKRITVTQRPDEGTITATPTSLWMSPTAGNASRTVSLWSTGAWRMVGAAPSNATVGPVSGNPYTSTIAVTRKSNPSDDGNYGMYGDAMLTLRNESTLETVDVALTNIYMRSDDIYMGNPHGADTTVVSDKIEIFGGSRRFTVTSMPEWVTSATCDTDGRLRISALRDPANDGREGFLTVTNADDPTYTLQVKIIQDIAVIIPAFNYFVLKFTWNRGDADVAFRFIDNRADFDNKPVGYAMGNNNGVIHNGQLLCKWGGDARGGVGETVFFNAPVIDGSPAALPRYITMEAYATWFEANIAPAGVMLTMSAYLGGTMVQQGTNFVNQGGTLLYNTGSTRTVHTTKGGFSNYYKGGYTKMCTIVYDRRKHSAQITWHAPQW
jgi:hypothetical protein